jgi:hypothetical protein
MIHHIVAWKLNGADEAAIDAQAAEITEALEALVGVVPSIGSFMVGRNIVHTVASYDLALVSEFASLEALQAYQVHPAHVAVAELIGGLAASRTVVDFEKN